MRTSFELENIDAGIRALYRTAEPDGVFRRTSITALA